MGQLISELGADILGIVIICFLIFLLHKNEILSTRKTKQYLFTTYYTLIIILLEILTLYFDAFPKPSNIWAAKVVNTIGFIFMFFLPLVLAMLYSKWIMKWHRVLFLLPFAGSLLFIANIWTEWFFYIDGQGIYHRGEWFQINILIALYGMGLLVFAHAEMAREYDNIEKTFLWATYALLVGTCLAQVLYKPLIIMWGGVAADELLYYVFLRELQFKYDAVTGVRNRNCFERHMAAYQHKEGIFIIECDVNDLKWINDTYGHDQGDKYLREAADLIRNTYGKYGIVYRTGGDEFVVIAEKCIPFDLKEAKRHLIKEIEKRQFEKTNKFYIASAYCQFCKDRHIDAYACLKEADQEMYRDKRESKQKNKEKSN